MKLEGDISTGPQLVSELGDPQERNPGIILKESTREATMSKAVLQDGEREATGGREHNHTGKPDFETVEIPPINIDSKSKQKVVEQG